jgi:hypothetical protein
MASVAAFTAAAGSVEPPGAPVPPVPPPDGVPVPEGAPLDACDELVPEVDGREDELVTAFGAPLVAALDVLLVVVDDDAYVCWSVWYADIADLYAASAARTAFWSGVLLIDASA